VIGQAITTIERKALHMADGDWQNRPLNDASPSLPPGVPDGTVLYDGVCVLCSAWFKFVAARDPEARFRFTPIQGEFGRQLAVHLGIDPDNPQTNAVIIGGKAYVRSDAALQILRRLPGWSWTRVFLALPRGPRDWFYDRVAQNRYKLFGRTDTCMVPDVNLRRHVLPENTPFG
jgi:predicted DCC family thiol-disulfide oxidoreductase YuxK